MSQSLTQLLLAYLPLIVFIGVAAVIGLALLVVPFLVRTSSPIRRNSPPTNAVLTHSMMRE
jgi:hypothetical protein